MEYKKFSILVRSGFHFSIEKNKKKQFLVQNLRNDLSQNNQKMELTKFSIALQVDVLHPPQYAYVAEVCYV